MGAAADVAAPGLTLRRSVALRAGLQRARTRLAGGQFGPRRHQIPRRAFKGHRV